MERKNVKTDVLIIGSAIAGFKAAVEAHDRGAKVLLLTKGLFGRDCGATWMAGVGFLCWGIYPHDTLDVHVEDTLRCGWFLNNQENTYAFLAHVPDTVRDLVRWGARFRMKDGEFWPWWQLGNSTEEGRALAPSYWPPGELGYNFSRIIPRVIRNKKIDVMEDIFVTDLLTKGDTVVGAVGFDIRTGEFLVFQAKVTILATGGYLGVNTVTTGNPNLTGDGQAMALRAGVDMMDFEFNQTLPIAVWPPAIAGYSLPFRLLWYADGRMYNSDNERFLAKWDKVKMERSTRAVISRAIYHEIEAGKASPHGGIYTGVTHNPENVMEEKFKDFERHTFFKKLKQCGVDLRKDYLETVYAIHYSQGGCKINTKCETDKPGLYAIGEVSSGSKDGADRMMSNALPYCIAMGTIAGREAASRVKSMEMPEIDDAQVGKLCQRTFAPLAREHGERVFKVKAAFQDIMTRETAYGRTEKGLKAALDEVERLKKEVLPRLWVSNKSKRFNHEWVNALEFENLVLVAECIIRNSLMRTESRGLHDRLDHLDPDPAWYKNIHLRLLDGELKQWTTPVEFTYWEPEPGSLGEPWHRGVQIKEYKGWRAEPLYKKK